MRLYVCDRCSKRECTPLNSVVIPGTSSLFSHPVSVELCDHCTAALQIIVNNFLKEKK